MYPEGNGKKNIEIMTSTFRGVNRLPVCREGELSDCRNIESDFYPAASVASGFEDVKITVKDEAGEDITLSNIQCIMQLPEEDKGFSGVADGKVYVDGRIISAKDDAAVTISADSHTYMYKKNGEIYIVEIKKDGTGWIYGAHYKGRNVTEEGCYPIGQEIYLAIKTKEDDIYAARKGSHIKLEMYKTNTGWAIHLSSYNAKLPSSTDNDTVQFIDTIHRQHSTLLGKEIMILGLEDVDQFMNVTGNGKGPVKAKCTDFGEYQPPEGDRRYKWGVSFFDEVGNYCEPNKLPEEDYGIFSVGVIVDMPPQITAPVEWRNRIWAGTADGKAVIATASGTGADFYKFEDLAGDSVEIEIPSPGKFTGCIVYGDSLVYFKQNSMGVIYGDLPENFSVGKEISGVGCIDIKSACVLGGILYFLSSHGFYAYSGGQPQNISRELNTVYVSAKAFCHEGKYYADAKRKDGQCELLVYDAEKGMWLIEESEEIECAFSKDTDLYIGTKSGIKRHLARGEQDSKTREWYLETGDLLEGIIEKKGMREIYVRAFIPEGGRMMVSVCGEDGVFSEKKTVYGTGRITTYRVPVRLKKSEAYRIRIEGEGKAIIYDICRSVSAGGRNIKEMA